MKISAIIVDDEVNNIDLLKHFLEKYCPVVHIVGSASSKEEAVRYINSLQPDVVFLDVVLNNSTGFDVLEEVTHSNLKVIFVTSYDQYAVRAFKYNSVDYILKPIDIEELVIAVNRVYKEIENSTYTSQEQILRAQKGLDATYQFDFLAIPSMDKIEFVDFDDIIYLKSDGRYTVFYLIESKKITASKNLGEFESTLDTNLFFRIHNSYIVNLKHVVKINKAVGAYCEMSNREALPIAKRRQDALSKFLGLK